GSSLVMRGSYEEGVAELESCVRANPELTVALWNLGLTQERLGRTDDAQRTLRKLFALDKPTREKWWFIYLRNGGGDEALASRWAQILRAEPWKDREW